MNGGPCLSALCRGQHGHEVLYQGGYQIPTAIDTPTRKKPQRRPGFFEIE
jgi:arylsulfatase A-like enzyme